MKLSKIQNKLKAAGIEAEMKDFSLEDETMEALWDRIRMERTKLAKWEQNKDAVMVAIISRRIARLSQRIMEKKEGKVLMVSMTTTNLDGRERTWGFRSVSEILSMWWTDKAIDLPSGEDHVIKLMINGREHMACCCFEEVVRALEEEYWENLIEIGRMNNEET